MSHVLDELNELLAKNSDYVAVQFVPRNQIKQFNLILNKAAIAKLDEYVNDMCW